MTTRPAGLDTRRLAPTGLAELNAAAGLLVRVDRKYLVPLATAQGLVDALAGAARVLQIEGRRGFSYASTYFDTPDLDSYLLAARKRRRRFKIRTRSYLDSGSCFLEVKTRGPRGATVKRRVQCPPLDAGRLTASGRDFIASRLADDVAPPERARRLAQALEPVLITRYERTTLHLPEESARLTLDTRLAWIGLPPRGAPAVGRAGSAGGQGGRTGDAGGGVGRAGGASAGGHHIPVRAAGALAIVETKTPAAPSAADRWLWAAGHRPAAISKYATGMALLHPELPANKWHRVLTRELAAARAGGCANRPTAGRGGAGWPGRRSTAVRTGPGAVVITAPRAGPAPPEHRPAGISPQAPPRWPRAARAPHRPPATDPAPRGPRHKETS